jgi:hypothetical protein
LGGGQRVSKLVLTNAQVLVNSVDISNHVSSVDISSSRDEVDVTSMGDTSKEIVLGLGDVTFTITVFNDYAAGNMDSQMFALNSTNTPFVVEVRPVNGARSTSNPGYTITALMPTYKPISGSVGAAVTTDLVFRNASQTGLQRNTA